MCYRCIFSVYWLRHSVYGPSISSVVYRLCLQWYRIGHARCPSKRLRCWAKRERRHENGSVARRIRYCISMSYRCLSELTAGVGAFLSPLVATQFAEIPRWSFHYLTSLLIAVINLIALIVVFRGKRQEGQLTPSALINYVSNPGQNCKSQLDMHLTRANPTTKSGTFHQ